MLDTSCLKIYVYGALKWRLARLLKSLTDIIEQVHSSPASSSYAMKTFAAVLAAGVLGKHTTLDIFLWQEKDGKWRSSNYRTVTSVTDPSLLPTFADTLGLSHRGFASWHAPGTAPSSSYTPAILSILLERKMTSSQLCEAILNYAMEQRKQYLKVWEKQKTSHGSRRHTCNFPPLNGTWLICVYIYILYI